VQNTVVIDAFLHSFLQCASGTLFPHSVQTLALNENNSIPCGIEILVIYQGECEKFVAAGNVVKSWDRGGEGVGHVVFSCMKAHFEK